jgi:hypothetical protein
LSDVARELFEALLSAVDEERLEAALRARVGGWDGQTSEVAAPPVDPGQPADAGDAEEAAADSTLHGRLLLADLLGDDIVGARPGDASFPVRVFISKLGEQLEDDGAFALANGLSFYFRATMDEEARVRIGLEVSRLYYAFAGWALEESERKAVSPLLARLMSAELERLRFEAVDHEPVFDSALHERGKKADASSKHLQTPETFLCRVDANDMVRFKAVVTT